MSEYFTDREFGPRPRIEQTISSTAWAGIVATIDSRIQSGAFGLKFPMSCADGQVTCGHDPAALANTVGALIPGVEWPLTATVLVEKGYMREREAYAPQTPLILDLIEFVYASVAKPIQGEYHSYMRHHHLSFDQQAGQQEFAEDINRIFSRNGIAFELHGSGQIRRLVPPVIGEELRRTYFNTGDRTLDVFLEECKTKFTSRDPLVRREALERLCDALERMKTLRGDNKPNSIRQLLDSVTTEQPMRARLETELKELTDIANAHLLRHTELKQVAVTDTNQVDWIFHRMFALIHLILRPTHIPA